MDQKTIDAIKTIIKRLDNNAIQSIAKDVDFKPYLDAVTKSSERSRSTLYFIFVVSVVVFTTGRAHVMPAWQYSRLTRLQIAQSCLKKHDYKSDACKSNIDHAIQHIYNSDLMPDNVNFPDFIHQNSASSIKHTLDSEIFEKLVNEQVTNLLKKKVESLSVQIPIVGIQIDINDLGFISGGIFVLLFFILNTNLSRELVNLKEAHSIAPDYRSRKLLLMTQVLSGVSGSKVAPPRMASYLLIITPLLSLGYIVVWDLNTINIADILAGSQGMFVVIIESIFLLILIPMIVTCFIKWDQINHQLSITQKSIYDEVSKINANENQQSQSSIT
ncbi:MAG: hypothetical protein QM758_06255 [Armatimonas sp.]